MNIYLRKKDILTEKKSFSEPKVVIHPKLFFFGTCELSFIFHEFLPCESRSLPIVIYLSEVL